MNQQTTTDLSLRMTAAQLALDAYANMKDDAFTVHDLTQWFYDWLKDGVEEDTKETTGTGNLHLIN